MRSSTLLSSLALLTPASPQCTRELLQAATDAYTLTQSHGLASSQLSPLSTSSTLNYTENFKSTPLHTSILTTPLLVNHNISIHDPLLCRTFTELIIATSPKQYVIGTRMLIAPSPASTLGYEIAEIESIVTQEGDWLFNATGYTHWESFESIAPIPIALRDTRATIQAAGDAYFDRFANASVVVPYGVPCARLEGGAYTGARDMAGNTCNLGLPSTIHVAGRKYVVDEVMGMVDMFLGFPGLDRTQPAEPMPDSHLFRVEGGKIRWIHTVSYCATRGCGNNATVGL